MKSRHNPLDARTIILPKGTRVVLRHQVHNEARRKAKPGTLCKVTGFDGNQYTIQSPAGDTFTAPRDHLVLQNKDLLKDLGQRQWEFHEFEREVCLEVVVGSTAWGLSDDNSDEDVRGVFVLPAEARAGLWDPPNEIHHPATDTAYWEIGKCLMQALRGDANTLEVLWSPLVKKTDETGEDLRAHRRIFLSKNVEASFGRYALSQFDRIQRDLRRNRMREILVDRILTNTDPQEDDMYTHLRTCYSLPEKEARNVILDVCRSAFDKGLTESRNFQALVDAVRGGIDVLGRDSARYRPKNAYNLIRLLHSATQILRGGEPLIEIADPTLKEHLFAIKRGEVPIEETVAEARSLGDEVMKAASVSSIPDNPDYEAAHRLLLRARKRQAVKWVGT